jgi:hypothetical protein
MPWLEWTSSSPPAVPTPGQTRTKSAKVERFVNWDLCDYANPAQRDNQREISIQEELDSMGADVYAVQGIMGTSPHNREAAFVVLAARLGLSCTVRREDGVAIVVFDPGRGPHGVGLMWRPSTVTPWRGTARRYDTSPLACGMALARLEVEGVAFTVASALLPAHQPQQRVQDCGYIALEVFNAGPLGSWGRTGATCSPPGQPADATTTRTRTEVSSGGPACGDEHGALPSSR